MMMSTLGLHTYVYTCIHTIHIPPSHVTHKDERKEGRERGERRERRKKGKERKKGHRSLHELGVFPPGNLAFLVNCSKVNPLCCVHQFRAQPLL